MRVVGAASIFQSIMADPLPGFFGQPGATTPALANPAQYMLDLDAHGTYLHYHGDGQIFVLALSPRLREHLRIVASESDTAAAPIVYGLDHLEDSDAGLIADWSRTPGWSGPSGSGADAQHVFYGREIRSAPGTAYGKVIQLSLGPDEDPEGWTVAEMRENYQFWEEIEQEGKPVPVADEVRSFRHGVAALLGGTFEQRWGANVVTKAHRFVMQLYTAESQTEANNPGGHFFEMFPENRPPTRQVVFFEAEDGCKGTPTPIVQTDITSDFTQSGAFLEMAAQESSSYIDPSTNFSNNQIKYEQTGALAESLAFLFTLVAFSICWIECCRGRKFF